MLPVLANYAATTLASGLDAGVESLTVTSTSGWPVLAGGEYLYAVLTDGIEGSHEVVKVTSMSGATWGVLRGLDGTTAVSWPAGSKLELRLVAAVFSDLGLALSGKSSLTHNHDTAYLGITATAADSDLLDGQHGSYYAADSAVVHIAGAETISGTKTFTANTGFSGRVGMAGATPATNVGLYIGQGNQLTGISGTTQYGFLCNGLCGTDATTYFGIYGQAGIKAGTAANYAYGASIASPNIEATATVTNVYGLRIYDQTGGSSTNYAIYTGAGAIRLGDAVTCTSTVTGSAFIASGASTAAASLSKSSTVGLKLTGSTGSSYDAALYTPDSANYLWTNPTGTLSFRTYKPQTEILAGTNGIYHHHDVCGIALTAQSAMLGVLILSMPEYNYSTMISGRIQGIDYRSDGIDWEIEFGGYLRNYTAGTPNTVINWVYPTATLVRGKNISSVQFLRSEDGTTWPKHIAISATSTGFSYCRAALTDLLTTVGSSNGRFDLCRMRFAARCRVGTTAALPSCAYSNGTAGVGATLTASANGTINPLDGVTLSVNDVVLVKDQANGYENGVYVVTAIGDASNPWILTRAVYADSASELYSGGGLVSSGTVNANRTWIFTQASTITVGTDAITSVELVTSGTQPTLRRLVGDTDSPTWTGTHNFSGAKIGGASDYSRFEADGTLTMTGAATTFDDLAASTLGLQVSGSGVSHNLAEAQTEFTTASNLSDYVVASCQLPHAWRLASVVYPHLHWVQTTSGVPNFLLQYRWQTAGSAKVTSWTSLACNTAASTYTSGSMSNIAKTASGITPPAGASLSDILQFRILRDNANTSTLFSGADPVAATAAITSFDLHIERDTLGSRTEYTK